MELICIRHTKVAVPSGICYGHTDVGLASSYDRELLEVAGRLEGFFPEEVFSSPLKRCIRLAGDLFPESVIKLDNRLKELNFGFWEGKSWDEIYRSESGRFWMDHYLTASCDGGESYPELRDRVGSFLRTLTASGFGRVVLVTHGGVIRLIKSLSGNLKMDEVFASFNPDFGGVYTFRI